MWQLICWSASESQKHEENIQIKQNYWHWIFYICNFLQYYSIEVSLYHVLIPEKFCFLSPCTQLRHFTFFRALFSSIGGVTGVFFPFLVYKFCAFNQSLQLVYSKASCSQGSCFPNLQWKMYIISIIVTEHNKHMDNGICFRSHCN